MKRLFLGVFGNEEDLLRATEAVCAEGLQIADVYTPYAVHGLDKAMGLAPSRLGRVCFGFGVLGVIVAFVMQFWTSAIDWPINVGGRPWNSWPAFVPVAFEVMVLLASFGVVIAFFVSCRLFPGRKPQVAFAGIAGERFVLALEETNASFDVRQVRALLKGFGALETIESEGNCLLCEQWQECQGFAAMNPACPLSSPSGDAAISSDGACPVATTVCQPKKDGDAWLTSRKLNLGLLAALVAVVVLNFVSGTNLTQPNVEFMPDMAHSVSYQSFAANPNFPNGRTLQAPVADTIPRGRMPLHFGPTPEEALRAGKELKSPVPTDDPRGKQRGPVLFANHCQICHGAQGKGDGPVTLRGVPPPPSLLAQKAVDMPDGQMFHVLTFGQGNMASYAAHLTVDERWHVIAHIRGLQKQAGGK